MPIVVAAIAAVAAVGGGVAKSRALRREARIKRQQARSERHVAREQARSFRRRQSGILASSRALRAGSGLAALGSPLMVDEATAGEIELGAQNIIHGGEVRRRRLKTASSLLIFQAQITMNQAFTSGVTQGAAAFAGAGGGATAPATTTTAGGTTAGAGTSGGGLGTTGP